MEEEEEVSQALEPFFSTVFADPVQQKEMYDVYDFWNSCRSIRHASRRADPAIVDAAVARVVGPSTAELIEAVLAWDSAFLVNYVLILVNYVFGFTAADAAAAEADNIVDVAAELAATNSTLMELRDALDPGPALVARGFNQALAIVDDAIDRRPIRAWTIRNSTRGGGDDDDDDDEIRINGRSATEIQAFRRFVELLGQREGGRFLFRILFEASLFGLPDEEMGQLFGDVLPNNRTLWEVSVDIGKMPIQFFRMLTESIPSTPTTSLSTLSFTGVDIVPEIKVQVGQAVADMLRRNAVIQRLNVRAVLNCEACELICQALPGNTNLRELNVEVEEVFANTLVGVAESSLRSLSVRGAFSEGAAPSLARQLRTNTTLQSLTLNDTSENGRIGDSQALLELVRTYNYTLQRIDGNLERFHGDGWVRHQFWHYMRRNARIRSAFEELESPDPDRRLVMAPDRLSSALELVSDVPTALFKIVKLHANVILLASLQNRDRVHP